MISSKATLQLLGSVQVHLPSDMSESFHELTKLAPSTSNCYMAVVLWIPGGTAENAFTQPANIFQRCSDRLARCKARPGFACSRLRQANSKMQHFIMTLEVVKE